MSGDLPGGSATRGVYGSIASFYVNGPHHVLNPWHPDYDEDVDAATIHTCYTATSLRPRLARWRYDLAETTVIGEQCGLIPVSDSGILSEEDDYALAPGFPGFRVLSQPILISREEPDVYAVWVRESDYFAPLWCKATTSDVHDTGFDWVLVNPCVDSTGIRIYDGTYSPHGTTWPEVEVYIALPYGPASKRQNVGEDDIFQYHVTGGSEYWHKFEPNHSFATYSMDNMDDPFDTVKFQTGSGPAPSGWTNSGLNANVGRYEIRRTS
jgi:hypothetical protein